MSKKALGIGVAVVFGLGILFVSFRDGSRSAAIAQEASKPAGGTANPHGNTKPETSASKPVDTKDQVVFNAEKLPKIVATVDKTNIDRETFTRVMKNVLGDMSQRGEPLTAEKLKALETKVMDHLVNSELLSHEAKAEKIKVDEKAVDSQFASIKGRFPSEDEFGKVLKQQNMTIPELKDDIRRGLLIRNLIEEKVLKGIKVSEADAKKFYDGNKDKFQMQEMVKASHIIIRTDQGADATKKAEAKKKIEEVQAKLKAGEKFEDLAKKYSEDGAKVNGGDLGFFPRGVMVKEFEDVVFAMKPGEVSGVISTQFGFHIIKMVEKKPAGVASFDEVKADVMRGLEAEAKRDKAAKFIGDLKAKAVIKTYL